MLLFLKKRQDLTLIEWVLLLFLDFSAIWAFTHINPEKYMETMTQFWNEDKTMFYGSALFTLIFLAFAIDGVQKMYLIARHYGKKMKAFFAAKKNVVPAIFLAFTLSLALPAVSEVYAADTTTASQLKAELPSTTKITKDDDLSSSMLADLIGPTWKTLTGGKAENNLGGISGFGNILAVLLEMVNLAAMVMLSCGIIYMWGIFSVTTAHEGKKLGGSIYNSMWFPVRCALSYTLVVPVMGGYSILQCIIIATVGLSINFANIAWDTAGSYLLKTMTFEKDATPPPLIQGEAMEMISPLFNGSTAYVYVTQYGKKGSSYYTPDLKKYEGKKEENVFYLRVPKTIRESKKVGGYTFISTYSPNDGEFVVTLCPTTAGEDPGDFGSVTISCPKEAQKKEDPKMYEAQMAIAKARKEAVMNLWAQLLDHAGYYLSLRGITEQKFNKPAKSGLDIVKTYMDEVSKVIKEKANAINGSTKIKDMIAHVIDSDLEKSRVGWVTAGLFSYPIVEAKRRIDNLLLSKGATYTGPKTTETKTNKDGVTIGSWLFFKSNIEIKGDAATAIQQSHKYARDELLKDHVYMAETLEGDGPSTLNKLITTFWIENGWEWGENKGLVQTTLEQLAKEDPVLVMTDIGSRLYSTSLWMSLISFVGQAGTVASAALALSHPVGALAAYAASTIVTNPIYFAILSVFFICGLILKFAVPLTPIAIWLYAVLSWFLRVCEALIAAPFWAVAHVFPEGQGFAGQQAKKGYILMLDIVCRPLLMVIGAVISIAIWRIAGKTFGVLLANSLSSFSMFDMDLDTQIILTIAILFIIFYLYTKIFVALISTFPDRIVDWLGQVGARGLGEESAGHQLSQGFSLTASRMSGMFAANMTQRGELGGRVGKALETMKNKNKNASEQNAPGQLPAITEDGGGGGTSAATAPSGGGNGNGPSGGSSGGGNARTRPRAPGGTQNKMAQALAAGKARTSMQGGMPSNA